MGACQATTLLDDTCTAPYISLLFDYDPMFGPTSVEWSTAHRSCSIVPVHHHRSAHDASVIARIRDGNVSAFEQLYQMYAEELWRHAYRILQERDVAEDVVQDVFVSLWTARETLIVQASVRAYLYTAVHHRALKVLRHDRVVRRTGEGAMASDVAAYVHSQTTLDTTVEEAELTATVQRTLASLPERQRAAIELRWLRGLNQTEVATVLGVSEAAVRKLIDKALIRLSDLRQRLKEF